MPQILKRNIIFETLAPNIEAVPTKFRVDFIDGCRVSLRWVIDEQHDIIVNLTEEETRKLRRCLVVRE